MITYIMIKFMYVKYDLHVMSLCLIYDINNNQIIPSLK